MVGTPYYTVRQVKGGNCAAQGYGLVDSMMRMSNTQMKLKESKEEI